jgi:hypothetical protein
MPPGEARSSREADRAAKGGWHGENRDRAPVDDRCSVDWRVALVRKKVRMASHGFTPGDENLSRDTAPRREEPSQSLGLYSY